jgi:hypothetical protein
MQNQLSIVCAYSIDILWVVGHVTYCPNKHGFMLPTLPHSSVAARYGISYPAYR